MNKLQVSLNRDGFLTYNEIIEAYDFDFWGLADDVLDNRFHGQLGRFIGEVVSLQLLNTRMLWRMEKLSNRNEA